MMGRENNKIFFKYLFCIIPFFIPDIFNYKFPKLVTIFRLLQILIFFIYFIKLIKRKKISKLFKYIGIYTLLLFLITFILDGDIYYNLKNSLSVLGLCLVCEICIQENYKQFVSAMFIYFSILNMVNFATIVFFPDGMYLNSSGLYNNWFLGYKNAHILYIFPWILLYIFKIFDEKGIFSRKTYLLIALSLIFTVYVDSSTATLSLFLLLFFLIFRNKFNKIKFLSMRNLSLIVLVLFFTVVIFRVQNFLSIFVINLLNRSITFTGRTSIWDFAIAKIQNSFLTGYGDNAFYYNPYILSTHNQFLGILFETGIVGLIIFGLLLHVLIKKLDSVNSCDNALFAIFKYFVFLYLLMMLMEEYNMRYYMYVFVIIYNLCIVKKQLKEN